MGLDFLIPAWTAHTEALLQPIGDAGQTLGDPAHRACKKIHTYIYICACSKAMFQRSGDAGQTLSDPAHRACKKLHLYGLEHPRGMFIRQLAPKQCFSYLEMRGMRTVILCARHALSDSVRKAGVQ